MSASGGASDEAPMDFENGEHSRSYEDKKQNGGTKVLVNKLNLGTRQQKNEYINYKYKESDEGPYKVIVEKKAQDNDKYQGINKISIGLILKQNGFTKAIVDIKKTARAKVLVYLTDWEEANRMTTCQNLTLKRYKAYIPKGFVTVKGVVQGIPEDIDTQELQSELETNREIVEIFRMKRWVTEGTERVQIPTNKVGVIFRCNKLPTHVKIFAVNMKVIPYITRTIMCHKCLRFGHLAADCKGKKRCPNCGDGHETVECENEMKCANCKGPHKATDQNCPTRAKQTEIKQLMATRNLTYYEAQQETRVPTNNQYSILEHADEFMTIKESYLEALKKGTQAQKPKTLSINTGTGSKLGKGKQNQLAKEHTKTINHDDTQKNKKQEKGESSDFFTAPTKKRKAETENGNETISLQQHLELRQKWNNKINELAVQRESYKQTNQEVFNELTNALKQNNDAGYANLINKLKNMALNLGYFQRTDVESACSENIQVNTK